MKKLSRGAMAAVAAAIAIPAGVAIAKSYEHMRWHAMSPETRARLDEGKLAMAKTALKLSPEQEKLWAPLETEIRGAFKARDAHRAEWEKKRAEVDKDRADGKEPKRPDMAERIDRMSQTMSERADRMKAFASAFKPFYASLSEEQKDVLRPLARQLMPGGGHHGHGGPRWAFGGGWGGWGHGGPDGGWGGHGHHDGRGGPEDRGGGGGPGGDRAPPAPQNAPDFPGDDEAPAPTDTL